MISRQATRTAFPPSDLEAPTDADEVPPDPQRRRRAAGEDTEPAVSEARVLAALAAAAAFYAAEAPRSWVPAYLTGRGLPATAAGYAPATWTALVNHLRQAGYTDQEILAAGLARHSSRGGLIDFFHNRAVLPITRPQDGAVVAFIGRKHPDDTNDRAPKYLNSPTTTVFRKSDLPFGLTPRQVDLLRAGADLVIVEGPMDALAVNVARPGPGRRRTPRHRPHPRAPGHPEPDRPAHRPPGAARSWTTTRPAGQRPSGHGGSWPTPASPMPTRSPSAKGRTRRNCSPTTARTPSPTHSTARYPLADLVVDEITHRWTDGNDFVEHRINALREAAHLIGTMPPAQQTRQASRLAEHLDLDYLTVIDAILDNTPPDPDAVAPDPTDPLGLPKRPTLSTDPQPAPDPGRDRSELGRPVARRTDPASPDQHRRGTTRRCLGRPTRPRPTSRERRSDGRHRRPDRTTPAGRHRRPSGAGRPARSRTWNSSTTPPRMRRTSSIPPRPGPPRMSTSRT